MTNTTNQKDSSATSGEPPCHARPQADWCDRHGAGGFMGHTCYRTPAPQAATLEIEYRYTGGTHWCPLGPAERMKANFDGVYRLKASGFPVWQGGDSPEAAPTLQRAMRVLRDLLQDVRAGVLEGDAVRDAQALLDSCDEPQKGSGDE